MTVGERRVRAALVTPSTGPLGGYGRAGAEALRLWAEGSIAAARPGPDPPTIDLLVYDAHPDPVDAVRRAEAGDPHLVFGPYGSGPTRAVAAATRRLLINHGGAGAGGVGAIEAANGPDAPILAAARALDCTTLFGRFRLDPLTGAQIGHEVVTVQWQGGRRRVVWPAGPAAVPVRLR